MKQKLPILFLLLAFTATAQNTKLLKGKVLVEIKELSGINVRNLSSEKMVLTSEEGLFSIAAKAGDTLLLTAIQLEDKRIVVEKEDFDYLPFLVRMRAKVTQLKEVVVKGNTIDEVSLGIVSKKVKPVTPAERRLATAGDFKPIHLLNILGGSLPFDPIINKINGKTARLKKEIKVERSELLQKRLSNMFEDSYFVEELKISPDHVAGFKVFAAENPELTTALANQNKILVAFTLTKLAVEYKNRSTNEN
ncbi:transposase [Flavobacterium sp. SM15]|uniref:transposase n=1 Tax=Flavobacterium sp. SM15 TaxID=2908005 RepID=UPI001EDC34AA|nr:transposase [Flavobacterium sp. SM15]MCG2610734.1 transposase [Flavobacterium sp. SM15]